MKFPYTLVFCCLLFQLTSSCDDTHEQKESQTVLKNIFIGTYTRTEGHVDGKANGIYRLVLDQQGTIKKISQAAQVVNPSFVSIDPRSRFLYAVSETGADDGEEGSLFSYCLSLLAYAGRHMPWKAVSHFICLANVARWRG